MFVRKGATTSAAAPELQIYAEGVRQMKERSKANAMDPLGWTYQSRMHGNPEAMPRAPDEPEDWSQCQHGTWWFLPWHRMYLLQFERIIRWFTGATDWALPYWDYSTVQTLVIPPPFLDSESALFNASRKLRQRPIAPATWQNSGTFTAFGGAPSKEPEHRGEEPGALEENPHNPVHGSVGGDMAGFQSPLDALFWIHHCNIDRLWEAWLTLPNRSNPIDKSWLDTSFDFPDPESGRRRLVVRDVTSAAAAGYSYDDFAPPRLETADAAVLGVSEERFAILATVADRRKDDRLELLGATSGSGSVSDRVEINVLPRAADRWQVLRANVDAAAQGEVVPLFLRLENVGMESGDASSMWNVFVRARPEGEPHLVGTIAPFGLAGLTSSGGRQTLTFDISHLSDELTGAGPIEVTFEPVDDEVEGRPFWERAGLYTTAD